MSAGSVLLVEDNPGDARLIEEAIVAESSPPFRVARAACLAEGCALASREQFAVILLDLSLPDSHGLDTLRRARQAAPSVPIVVLTGLNDDSVAVSALGQGAQDYLVKGHADEADIRKAIRYSIERHELHERLAEARKLDAVGRLSGALAHEFNNLMQVVLGNCEFLRESIRDEGLCGLVCEISAAGERAAALARQMLAAGGRKRVLPATMGLNDAVRGAEQRVRDRASTIDVEFDLAAAPDTVTFTRAEVEALLDVMTANAVEAMPGGGRLSIATSNVVLDDRTAARLDVQRGAQVALVIRDTGVGMPEDVRARLFEPFFKTKRLDRGTGLSLAGIYGTLKRCGAAVSVSSAPGAGTEFSVYFPAAVEIEAA